MKTFIRFGKRIAVPSTVQLRHELRAFIASEEVREECAATLDMSATASWDEIYARRAAAAARI
jgi:hypothetical protein